MSSTQLFPDISHDSIAKQEYAQRLRDMYSLSSDQEAEISDMAIFVFASQTLEEVKAPLTMMAMNYQTQNMIKDLKETVQSTMTSLQEQVGGGAKPSQAEQKVISTTIKNIVVDGRSDFTNSDLASAVMQYKKTLTHEGKRHKDNVFHAIFKKDSEPKTASGVTTESLRQAVGITCSSVKRDFRTLIGESTFGSAPQSLSTLLRACINQISSKANNNGFHLQLILHRQFCRETGSKLFASGSVAEEGSLRGYFAHYTKWFKDSQQRLGWNDSLDNDIAIRYISELVKKEQEKYPDDALEFLDKKYKSSPMDSSSSSRVTTLLGGAGAHTLMPQPVPRQQTAPVPYRQGEHSTPMRSISQPSPDAQRSRQGSITPAMELNLGQQMNRFGTGAHSDHEDDIDMYYRGAELDRRMGIPPSHYHVGPFDGVPPTSQVNQASSLTMSPVQNERFSSGNFDGQQPILPQNLAYRNASPANAQNDTRYNNQSRKRARSENSGPQEVCGDDLELV